MIELRAWASLGGMSLLILGMLMILFGSYTYNVNVPKLESKTIFENESFIVGDIKVYKADFSKNITVTCIASIKIPATDDIGEINFYVIQGEEFQKWERGEKDAKLEIELIKTKNFNKSFKVDNEGTYYFVFDNTFSEFYKKELTFSVTIEYLTYVEETRRNYSIVYIGYLALVIGVIVTLYGLVRKPEITWM